VSENLDLVRSIYADRERGDWSRTEWADPEIEFVIADGPEPASWKGRMEMARAWRDYLSAWEDYRSEPEEFREIDGERVLVLLHHRGRGKTSGLDLEQMQANNAALFRIRDGKVTRVVIYFEREYALADLGLEG
jgi:ketosteroid isomerase-like protein